MVRPTRPQWAAIRVYAATDRVAAEFAWVDTAAARTAAVSARVAARMVTTFAWGAAREAAASARVAARMDARIADDVGQRGGTTFPATADARTAVTAA